MSISSVAIVVIARNEAQTLRSCLEAAKRATEGIPDAEILLVDSASTDGTAGIGVQAGIRVVRVRAASKRCPGAMRRIGASLVNSTYIMFLDGDCELEDGYLQTGLQRMEGDPKLGVLAGTRRDFYRVKGGVVPASVNYYANPRIVAAGQPAYGGCALYRASAIAQAGSFDPFLGAREEEDLAYRIQSAGFRIEVIDTPMIRHMTVPRESTGRLIRSLRHGFFKGRGQAARLFLSRGLFRASVQGLNRSFAALVHLFVGAASGIAWLAGISWPLKFWLGITILALLAFLVKTRNPRRVAYYVVEWIVQGLFLVVGFVSPPKDPATFVWSGDEYSAESRSENHLPKVLLVGPCPPPPLRGGVEKGVALLLDSRLARRTAMSAFNNFRVRDPNRGLWDRLKYQWGKLREFRAKLHAHPVDLVHVKTSSGINFYQNSLYALVAQMSGFQVLLQIHCGKFETFYENSGTFAKAWIRGCLGRANRVAVLSRIWQHKIGCIAPQAKITIVPNGLAEAEIATLSEDRYRVTTQVLFLGTGDEELDLEKGLADLVAVIPEVTASDSRVRWVLAGLGNPRGVEQALRKQFLATGASGNAVRCMGIVTGEERIALLQQSGVLVLPSYFENLPNILLEAMAAGMGIVASSVGAVPEMLEEGKGGLLVAPGDRSGLARALVRLLASPATILDQGQHNRRTLKGEYTMSVVEERLELIYRDLSKWPALSADPAGQYSAWSDRSLAPKTPAGLTARS